MSKSLWRAPAEALKYVKARPSHPKEIVQNSIKFLREKYKDPLIQAVDVGCGTGISTMNLDGEFQTALGLDVSPAMIEQAKLVGHDKSLMFLTSSAECMPVQSQSTQLVLAGRAIHYFDTLKFFEEVDRILVKNGVLAFYSVQFPILTSPDLSYGTKINEIFWRYLTVELADFWPLNPYNGHKLDWRRREYYVQKIPAPYPETQVDESISQTRSTTVSDIAREMETYSSFVNFRESNGEEASDKLLDSFVVECGDVGKPRALQATDRFFIVMSRKC